MREAPYGGGVLLYLARDAGGRAVWARTVDQAEVHATMREANRAALLAPATAGAQRPAYAIPASVLRADRAEPTAPRSTGSLAVVTPTAPEPEPLAAPAAPPGLESLWRLWVQAWLSMLFGAGRDARPSR